MRLSGASGGTVSASVVIVASAVKGLMLLSLSMARSLARMVTAPPTFSRRTCVVGCSTQNVVGTVLVPTKNCTWYWLMSLSLLGFQVACTHVITVPSGLIDVPVVRANPVGRAGGVVSRLAA